MVNKIKFIFMMAVVSICLGLMSNTYSRYVAGTTGNIDVVFAKWQILVNNTDITGNSTSTVAFVPTIEESAYVQSNVIAPSSKGYFDINIDPSNVDVSFKYTINLSVLNENVPDLMITKYAVIPNDYVDGDNIETVSLTDNKIENTLNYDKNTESFRFEPFTIRVYFEWYEGEAEAMNDVADTSVGNDAANNNTSFTMNANIAFEQIFQ